MKKTIIILGCFCGFSINAQSWNLTGNSGTTPANNFIGTMDNKELVIKTNNVEKLKISAEGNFRFKINSPTTDGVDIINETPVLNDGTDVVWIKSSFNQVNNVGLLTLSNANWQFPVFSARENGKVFIGIDWNNYKMLSCTDCNNYKLFVKNGIKTEKVKVEIAAENGWADYVFKDDYKLMPLKEVENFIKENGHLPEVPTTEEAIKNGIELKEMNILLLKKVEELTLHMINLYKDIQELKTLQTKN